MKKKLGFFEKMKLKKTAKKDAENKAFEDYTSGKKYPAINTVSGSKKDVVISAFMFTEMNEFAYKRDLYYKKHRCVYRNKIGKSKLSFRRRKFNVALSKLEKEVKDNIRQIDIARCNCAVELQSIEDRNHVRNINNTAPEITALCDAQKAECIRKCEAEVTVYKNAAVALLDEKKRLIDRVTNEIDVMFQRQVLRINTYYRWANKAMPELPAACADGEKLLQMSSINFLGRLSDVISDDEKERKHILSL